MKIMEHFAVGKHTREAPDLLQIYTRTLIYA